MKTLPQVPAQPERAARVAARLLQVAGCSPETHTILQDNVATLLHHFEDSYVASLEQLPAEKLMDGLNGTYANGPLHLALKLSRDIRQKPYSDEAVAARLEHLEGQLHNKMKQILEENPSYPCRFHVVGSLVKGRFGAHSDLDLLVEASPGWMASERRRFAPEEEVSVQVVDHPEVLAAFAPSREITSWSPGLLRQLFKEGRTRKGQLEVPPEAAANIMWQLPMV